MHIRGEGGNGSDECQGVARARHVSAREGAYLRVVVIKGARELGNAVPRTFQYVTGPEALGEHVALLDVKSLMITIPLFDAHVVVPMNHLSNTLPVTSATYLMLPRLSGPGPG